MQAHQPLHYLVEGRKKVDEDTLMAEATTSSVYRVSSTQAHKPSNLKVNSWGDNGVHSSTHRVEHGTRSSGSSDHWYISIIASQKG